MRILFYSQNTSYEETINSFKDKYLFHVDFTSDFEEAEYCADMRSYDFIILNIKNEKLLNILKYIEVNNSKAKTILFGSPIIEKFKDRVKNIFYGDLSPKELKELFEKSFFDKLTFHSINTSIGNLKIDIKDKKYI
jgi:hypothetical protein